jgi:large subunit ribosomal protein L19
MNLIQQIEAEEIAKRPPQKPMPSRISARATRARRREGGIEGERTRVQNYEGVCIARSNKGMGSNFTVRKMSFGEGVERVFPLYSPNIDSITVVRKGVVRRAKLYYLRWPHRQSARVSPNAAKRATQHLHSYGFPRPCDANLHRFCTVEHRDGVYHRQGEA